MANKVSKLKFNNVTYDLADESSRVAINNLEGQLEATRVDLNNMRAAVGSPLTAATTSAMTDTSKIYVYTGTTTTVSSVTFTAGNWYYHDGTKWQLGGVYNETALETDTTLTVSGAAADAKVTGDKVTELKNALDEIGEETIRIIQPDIIRDSYVDKSDGSFVSYAGWDRTDYIEVDPTKHIEITAPVAFNYNAMYDESKQFLGAFGVAQGTGDYYFREDTKYITLSGLRNAITGVTLREYVISEYYQKTDLIVTKNQPVGIFPLTGWRSGTLSGGAIVDNWNRAYSDYIQVEPYTQYDIKRGNTWMCFLEEYDENKQFLRATNYFRKNDIHVTSSTATYVRFVVANVNTSTNIDPGLSIGFNIAFKRSDPKKQLRVMTYNMGHYYYGTGVGLPASIYNEKLTNYIHFFSNMNIDVLGIQEFDSRMDSANQIWANDVLFDTYFPYKEDTGSWGSLKSKIPMIDVTKGQLSTGRWWVSGILITNQKPVYLLNVHLSVGVQNTSTRLTEAAEIVSMLSQYNSCILFGDFNAEPGEETALFNVFYNAGYSLGNCGWYGKYYTWSDPRENFNHYLNPIEDSDLYYIDNIITSPDITIRNVFPLPTAYGPLSSDHIPFVADVEVTTLQTYRPINLFVKSFSYNVKPGGGQTTGGANRALSLAIQVGGTATIKIADFPSGLQYSVALYDTDQVSSYIGYADDDWHTDSRLIYSGTAEYIRLYFGFSNNASLSDSTFEDVQIEVYRGIVS